MRLTGIIDYTMGNFLCVRGFAPMIDLADISKADIHIQRDLITDHRDEMEAFLSDGKFTFFPEVILCANMQGTAKDATNIDLLRERVKNPVGLKKTTISNIKYSTKVNSRKKEANSLAYDKTQTIVMEFEKSKIEQKKFLRIDGNHRLSAVSKTSPFKDKVIPYCLLLFSTNEETEKFCRALFYNINTKQIPLRMEENLKVIIESETVFDDDTLKTDPSFGMNYYLTRQITKSVNLSNYYFLNMFIDDNKFTYFVKVFDLLLQDNLIEKSDDSVKNLLSKLDEINIALESAFLEKIPNNLAVICTFTYYQFSNPDKAQKFLSWVKEHYLADIKDLHINDLINIYNKIYENAPKKVFMSMWFNKKTKNTYQAVKDIKDILKRDYNVEVEIIKVDEHRDGYSDSIYQRIVNGIDSCNLMLADLSHGNKNVHHEIGYAQGKGKKVLMIYHTREGVEDSDEIGSNISMHDQLRFDEDYGELRKQLLQKLKEFFDIG